MMELEINFKISQKLVNKFRGGGITQFYHDEIEESII